MCFGRCCVNQNVDYRRRIPLWKLPLADELRDGVRPGAPWAARQRNESNPPRRPPVCWRAGGRAGEAKAPRVTAVVWAYEETTSERARKASWSLGGVTSTLRRRRTSRKDPSSGELAVVTRGDVKVQPPCGDGRASQSRRRAADGRALTPPASAKQARFILMRLPLPPVYSGKKVRGTCLQTDKNLISRRLLCQLLACC